MPMGPPGDPPGCAFELTECSDDLDICDQDLETCEIESQSLPGDGYIDPVFGTFNHGPALSYTNNGDMTFTDNNTKYMWEIKLEDNGSEGGNCNDGTQANRSVHCVNNLYTWSVPAGSEFNGTISTEFLDIMNNSCDGDETTACTEDSHCTGIGNGLCGHAGYRDWFIPNIKHLNTLINYNRLPAESFPGDAAASYWSVTQRVANNLAVQTQDFIGGLIASFNKDTERSARAMRFIGE